MAGRPLMHITRIPPPAPGAGEIDPVEIPGLPGETFHIMLPGPLGP